MSAEKETRARPRTHDEDADEAENASKRARTAAQQRWVDPLYYSDYLQLDKILTAQKPKSDQAGFPAHDEHLFIVIHQVYELWFKQILHEIDSCAEIMNSDYVAEADIGTVVSRLNRVTEIQRILVSQLTVLETMTPLNFLDFRDFLFPASGFQSVQFRLLENKLGLPPKKRLCYASREYTSYIREQHAQEVKAAEKSASLHDLVNRWLERTPFLQSGSFSFWSHYRKAVDNMLEVDRTTIEKNPNLDGEAKKTHLEGLEKTREHFESVFDEDKYEERRARGEHRFSYKATQAALLINLYQHLPILHLPHRLLTLLLDVDELLTQWRVRHSLMVHRMLGIKIGTGGSSGYQYLHATAQRHRVFTDLFNLSTFFIPRHALPPLPKEVERTMTFATGPAQDGGGAGAGAAAAASK